jgi:hypothetical protein
LKVSGSTISFLEHTHHRFKRSDDALDDHHSVLSQGLIRGRV